MLTYSAEMKGEGKMKYYPALVKSIEVNPAGWITDYEINPEKGTMYIWTPLTKPNEPHEYILTKEKKKDCDDRMHAQFNFVIENNEEIMHNMVSKKRQIYKIGIALIVIALTCIPIEIATEILRPIFFSGTFIIGGNAIHIHSFKKRFKREVSSYEKYLENKQQIENISEEDKNVTRYLSKETTVKIQEKEVSKRNGITENIFDAQLLDYMPQKDRDKLLANYSISVGLSNEQEFKPKTRTRKK